MFDEVVFFTLTQWLRDDVSDPELVLMREELGNWLGRPDWFEAQSADDLRWKALVDALNERDFDPLARSLQQIGGSGEPTDQEKRAWAAGLWELLRSSPQPADDRDVSGSAPQDAFADAALREEASDEMATADGALNASANVSGEATDVLRAAVEEDPQAAADVTPDRMRELSIEALAVVARERRQPGD
ncbi:hypothetical protein [Streptacidiphilus anmyonensis]|uniref:hypothetical protein n=1 Tax=Streptacidiphilus anmyonensis TaxID=405782 RepID=UPI0005A72380|nr:hypothetical protein [Streptacidiphilus anmyonensis]